MPSGVHFTDREKNQCLFRYYHQRKSGLMEKVSVQYAGEILLGMPQTQRVAAKNVKDEFGITGGETTTENRS
jgi:hypothetical protein